MEGIAVNIMAEDDDQNSGIKQITKK